MEYSRLFCTTVDNQVWNDEKGRCTLKMTRHFGPGESPIHLSVQAQFVLPAGGVLSIPKIPRAPNFDQFRRHVHVFHTSRWDYKYTGGSEASPEMVNLRGKRVAIVGTGATSIQVVPELAKWAKHLYVIQRTPSYCGERLQRETDPETWAKVADGPGWQNRRRINFNHFVTNDPVPVDLVNDGWTDTPGVAGLIGGPKIVTSEGVKEHIDSLLTVDEKRANKVRARIEREVKDPVIDEKLKPWYPGWCKRPTFNDGYLATFNRPNVTLVDTDGKGLEGYTEHGILCGGQDIEVDVLVLSTGFFSGGTLNQCERLDSDIIGRDGRPFADKWAKGDFGNCLESLCINILICFLS